MGGREAGAEAEEGGGAGGGGAKDGGEGAKAKAALYCHCRQPWNREGEPMVGCDRKGCENWFHVSCIRDKQGKEAAKKAQAAIDNETAWWCSGACHRASKKRKR